MADIFISCLREDGTGARPVAEALEAAGYSVVWDFSDQVGDAYIEAVDRARAEARAILVLWSAAGSTTARLRVEAGQARDADLLVQATLDGSLPPAAFRTAPLADLAGWDERADAPGFKTLRGLLARVLKEPDRPALLSMDRAVWQRPLQERAKRSSVYVLPLLSVPVALTSAYALNSLLSAPGEPVPAALSPETKLEVMERTALIDALGVCPPEDAKGANTNSENAKSDAAAVQSASAEEDDLTTEDMAYLAMRDEPAAQYTLAMRYLKPGASPAERQRGIAWLERAAGKDYGPAQLALSDLYRTGRHVARDRAAALHWLRRAGEGGDAQAQKTLGVLYLSGEDHDGLSVERDAAEAGRWFKRAADQGLAQAAYNLGVIYTNGWGVPADHAKAVPYLRQAAEAGQRNAQWALGLLLYDGEEAVRNREEAVTWFKSAAQAGHPNAQYIMSVLHVKGEGVLQSNAMAYVWLDLAMAGGADQAALRAELRESLNETQALEADAAILKARGCLGLRDKAPADPETDLLS